MSSVPHTPFDIRQHLDCDRSGRTACPSCIQDGKSKQKNLSIDLSTGAYRCWRGCTPEQIREALGTPKSLDKTNPRSIQLTPSQPRTLTYEHVLRSQQRLSNYNDKPQKQAKQWLQQRGFTTEMIQHYHIGLERWQCNQESYWAISLHVPANAEDQFYRKLRIAPWLDDEKAKDLPKWSQYGVPTTVFYTYMPDDAEATWFCEGEWDAMRLGWLARSHQAKVAVCCSTAGCGSIPSQDQLNELPGDVIIFFDRNDTPTKDGRIPGAEGAKKLAIALQGRGKIAQVPMPENCQIQGWDVSNALDAGFLWADFVQAAIAAWTELPTSSPMQSVGGVLRDILEENDSPFQRDAALLEFAQDSPYTFRDIGTLAKSLSEEIEWELDQSTAAQKLQDLILKRPRPLDLNRFLEPWFAKILLDTAKAMPTAPEFLFTTLLPAAASRVGTNAQIIIKPSAKYSQPMLFWTAIVANSGAMKTPAQKIILDPLVAMEQEAFERYKIEQEEYEQKQLAGLTAKKPIRSRYLTKDATLETLQRIHGENRRGILLYRDELAGAIKVRNLYRGGRGADEEAELDQWTGSAMIIDRADKSVCISKSAVSRTGNFQWEVLGNLMGDHRDANGAWSRWLFCAADAPRRYINLQSDEPDTKIHESLTWLYKCLEEVPKQDYFLTPEAKFLFEAWQHQLVDTQQIENTSGLQFVYPKIEAYTARLALWLHVVNSVLRQQVPSYLISGETMEQAIELAAYFLWQHHLIHTHNSPESGLAAIALKIQKYVERVGESTASRLKSGIRALRKMGTNQIRQLMKTLADAGYGLVSGNGPEMVFATVADGFVDDIPDTKMSPLTSAEVQVEQASPRDIHEIDKSEIEKNSPPQTTPESTSFDSLDPDLERSEQSPTFERGQDVEIWVNEQWIAATYGFPLEKSRFSHQTEQLEDGHQVYLQGQQKNSHRVASSDLRPVRKPSGS